MNMRNKSLLLSSFLLAVLCPVAFGQETVTDSLSFDKASARTPAQLLQGRVSGVRVSSFDGSLNGAFSTLIRGVNALRGDSQPLWIVDGTLINASLTQNNKAFWQYGEKSYTTPLNALSYLNPYDIESIEVVKDLSDAAQYGSRGANGVIRIKTAMGSEDGFRMKVRSNLGLTGAVGCPEGTETGISHNHYLYLAGVSGRTRYTVSGSLRRMEGVFGRDDATLGGLRASFDTRANQALWFGMSTILSMGKSNSISTTSYLGQPSLTLSMRKMGKFHLNPLEAWKSDYDDLAQDRRLTTSMYLTFNLGKGFKWENTAGVDFLNDNRYIWYDNGLSFGLENNGAASVVGTSTFKYNGKSEFSWNRFVADDHHIVARVAVEASGDWNKFNVLNGTDFFSHVLRAKGVRLAASQAAPHKYDHNYNTWGLYGGASYAYKDIAGINLLYRADNTPRYDDKAFRGYKAGDLFVDLHKAFFPEAEGVSALRLEAGYGEAGREQYVPYGLYGDYVTGSYEAVDKSLEPFYEAVNRVRSREWHIGASFGFLADRILVRTAYYDKISEDAFQAYCFGALSGKYYWEFSDRQDDFSTASTLANRGFEADLDLVLVDNGSVKWSVNANAAYNINQMLAIGELDAFGHSVGQDIVCNANVLGHPVGALYGYYVDEHWKRVDVTRDGIVNEYDKDILGNPIPRWIGGLSTTLSSGRFTLDVQADGAAGFDLFNLNTHFLDVDYPFAPTQSVLKKGDYCRLSRVSIGYDIPMEQVRWIRGLSVQASALNLLTLTSYNGWDPSVNSFASSYLSHGIDYGSYPLMRSFWLGVQLQF